MAQTDDRIAVHLVELRTNPFTQKPEFHYLQAWGRLTTPAKGDNFFIGDQLWSVVGRDITDTPGEHVPEKKGAKEYVTVYVAKLQFTHEPIHKPKAQA